MTSARHRGDRPLVENREYAAFAARAIRGAGKRAGADIDMLPMLADLRMELEQAERAAVAALRADRAALANIRGERYSWADIGDRLGITRQTAWERFGRSTEPGRALLT